LLCSLAPFREEGAGKTGCRLAPMARCAKIYTRKCTTENRWAGKHPAFPAQWVDGLCHALPGDEFPFVTVASRIGDAPRPG